MNIMTDTENGAPKRKQIDWEAVERDYRAGMLSIREVAKMHGISDRAIRKKADSLGWERDLSEKVAEKVRNELVRTESALADQKQTEKEIVESAATNIVSVVLGHRKRYGRIRDISDTLMQQLEEAIANRDEIEEDIEAETAKDKDGKRRNRMLRAVSLSGHISDLVNLANVERTLTEMERKSFGMDDRSKIPDAVPTVFNMRF
jgi:hypothetical protein